MENNLYQTPQAELQPDEAEQGFDLASRAGRLGASLLDSLVLMIILLPLLYVAGWFDYVAQGVQPSFLYSLGMGLVSILVFFLINTNFLLKNGQTIGKKFVGIKIVDMDGAKPVLASHIIKRYLTYFVPNNIPIIGSIFGLVNILFIFRKDKRCIHDLVAGTQVVYSEPANKEKQSKGSEPESEA